MHSRQRNLALTGLPTSMSSGNFDVNAIANTCATFNANFKRERFLAACGGGLCLKQRNIESGLSQLIIAPAPAEPKPSLCYPDRHRRTDRASCAQCSAIHGRCAVRVLNRCRDAIHGGALMPSAANQHHALSKWIGRVGHPEARLHAALLKHQGFLVTTEEFYAESNGALG